MLHRHKGSKKKEVMRKSNIWKPLTFILASVVLMSTFVSCEDNNSNNETNPEPKTWNPYQLKANTDYEYDFQIKENGDVTSSGNAVINIGDPEVVVSGTIDGTPFSYTSNSFDDINQNFSMAVSQSPIAMGIYQPLWMGAFSNQALEVGNSWNYNYDNNSIMFEITGKDTFAGYEGFILTTTFTNDQNETLIWNSCVHPDIPLPIMADLTYSGGEEYYMELTNYSE